MRAIRAFAVALLVALVVAGCGGGGKKSSSSTGQTSTVGQGPLRVGLVTDIGQLNDRGFNQLAYGGLKRAEQVLGVKGRVFESASPADYVPNLSAFARQGYDLVVAVGFDQAAAVAKAAAAFPKTHFAIVDVSNGDLTGKPANVRGLVFKEQEAGYLAGYAAALQLKGTPAPHVIGSVGGQKQPPVDRYIAGYQAGAKAADPTIKLLNGYSQDWVDQAKCKEVALQQIASGAKVVFAVAGGCGLGVLDAAKEKKVWAIGVDADQGYLGKQVLTSALKKVDQSVFLTIQDVQDGTFKGGGDSVFGLDRDGVGVGKFSPAAKAGLAAAVAKVRQQIISGVVKDIPTTVTSWRRRRRWNYRQLRRRVAVCTHWAAALDCGRTNSYEEETSEDQTVPAACPGSDCGGRTCDRGRIGQRFQQGASCARGASGGDEGRSRDRHRRSQRPRLQPPGVRRPPAGPEAAEGFGPRARVEVGD